MRTALQRGTVGKGAVETTTAPGEDHNMMLVGVDLHSREQSVAMLDTTIGELQERRIQHDGDDVERFYAALQPPVTVAIESTGYALWFYALMRRLGQTLVVGDAAKIRATVVKILVCNAPLFSRILG